MDFKRDNHSSDSDQVIKHLHALSLYAQPSNKRKKKELENCMCVLRQKAEQETDPFKRNKYLMLVQQDENALALGNELSDTDEEIEEKAGYKRGFKS